MTAPDPSATNRPPHEHDRSNTELIRNMLHAFLRQQFGPDNVDVYEEDEFRIGIVCAPGNMIDVRVEPTVLIRGTTCSDCDTQWDEVFDLTEHKARWCVVGTRLDMAERVSSPEPLGDTDVL